MEEMNWFNTESGTPQGGIISPILCNIALNGLKEILDLKLRKGKQNSRNFVLKVTLVRFADDMIILGKSKEVLLTV